MRDSVRRSSARSEGPATRRATRRLRPRSLLAVSLWLVAAGVPSTVHAQGASSADPAIPVPPEPSWATLVDGWTFAVDVWLPVILAALVYWHACRLVARRHPDNPVPRWRLWSWLGGLAAIVLALASPVEAYDTTLFSMHMIQHLLLTMVAAPLLVLAAPITLLLRVSSPEGRKRWILPVLHSRVVRIVSHPVVTWSVFAAVMWFSHFSPLFDAALGDPGLHRLEHAIYLGAALLFWWPVVGADPGPHRMSYPARVLYLALGMPLSSLLGLVIFSSPTVLYQHYLTLGREWGWSPLEDQAWAGGIMWAGGDGFFVVAIVACVAAWLQHEERANRREDARLARQRAASRQG